MKPAPPLPLPLSAYSRPEETNPYHPDEQVYRLAELNLLQPDFHEHHRYQLLQVKRGDDLVWIRIDMGASSEWPSADQFRVLCGPGDSVASVQDYADRRREDMFWQKFLREQREASTMITDHIHFEEELRKLKAHRSTLGFAFTRQRD